MKKDKVLGLTGIDTRSLTLHLRDKGELRGIVSTKDFNKQSLIAKAQKHTRPVYRSTVKNTGKSKVTIIDLGINQSTLACYEGARIVSEEATAEKILSGGTEQVVISSGPGDPTALPKLVEEIKQLIGKVKIYGIQNGACLLAQAMGGKVYRMKVGHHGANQPVVDPKTGQGEISWQNHSYGVESLPAKVKVVHVNLNDQTIEKFQSQDGSCVGTLYFPIDQRGKLDPGYKYV
jgi:carbamoyl-phosphate synthase small subunit